MPVSQNNDIQFKNQDSPFTELFSLTCSHLNLNAVSALGRHKNQVAVISQHIDNAVETLLRGLQDVGLLVGVAVQKKKKSMPGLDNIGFFISAVSNLIEALNTLQSDLIYMGLESDE